MLLSEERGFVFVHVPKAGGSSIDRALGPWCLPRNRAWWASLTRWVGLPRDYRRFRFGKHDSLAAVQRVLPEETFRAWYKFAFVRNPWDRLVSDYTAVLADPGHRRHRRVRSLSGFSEYVRKEAPGVFPTQASLLRDGRGELGLDFVGRFESLERDFGKVCDHLGVEARLPHENKSEHGHYRAYYDTSSRGFVQAHWGEDVELFGYEF